MLLKKNTVPADVRKLSLREAETLSEEVRRRIIEVTTQNGGHIAASLGAVELIVSLLRIFDPDHDKIIFDVGHQAYAYKILTGRNGEFDKLRTIGGISGFPKPSESRYDHFVGGHAGNAVSAGCGYAMARSLSKENYEIISVIGDGVTVNGESAEGLNLATTYGKQIIVINDNTYSISAGVGSIPEYLESLRNKPYTGSIKQGADSPFALYDLDYLGPVSGHDISALDRAFTLAKEHDRSLIVHIVTKKGKGYASAEENPFKMHGIAPKGEILGEGFGGVFGNTLIKMREKDDKIVAVAAAMAIGTGLGGFASKYPDSFTDVGIAESTAITVAASLARSGYKPYVALYSTFLQRAYDQLLYDVALDGLDVTIILDRSGLVGEDGESHQGIYDLALLSSIPNITIASPSTYEELQEMLPYLNKKGGVKVVRYPKGACRTKLPVDTDFPHWTTIRKVNPVANIITHGSAMVEVALRAADKLARLGKEVGVINARFLRPMDEGCLSSLSGSRLFVLEDVIYEGSLAERLAAEGYPVTPLTLPNTYVTFGKPFELRAQFGIDEDSVVEAIRRAT